MKKEVISKKAPQAIGPYSQAVKFDNLVFCAGQIGMDPKTNKLVGEDIKLQAKQVLKNLRHVLEEAGADFSTVLKVNVYLKNMDDFPAINEIYAIYFKKPYPARATVEVSRLPKGALIEIDCIAFVNKSQNHDCDCAGGCGGDCC